MKKYLVIAAAAMLASCNSSDPEPAETPATEAEATVDVAPLLESNWSFTIDGKDYRESIDADGNYFTNVVTDTGEQHSDHGTYALVDGKQCFTSAMSDDGQVCWTTPPMIEVGDSVEVVNDAGDTLTVTRQEFEPIAM